MRILLIEDDPRLVDSLGRHLREAGFAVDISTDGSRILNTNHCHTKASPITSPYQRHSCQIDADMASSD